MNTGVLKFIAKGIIILLLITLLVGIIYWLLRASQWSWMAVYYPLLIKGLWLTLLLWVLSCVIGMVMAIPIGLVQVTGPVWLGALARGFCTVIRGTPLLLQLWLIYYGLGS